MLAFAPGFSCVVGLHQVPPHFILEALLLCIDANPRHPHHTPHDQSPTAHLRLLPPLRKLGLISTTGARHIWSSLDYLSIPGTTQFATPQGYHKGEGHVARSVCVSVCCVCIVDVAPPFFGPMDILFFVNSVLSDAWPCGQRETSSVVKQTYRQTYMHAKYIDYSLV